ncbi:MAG: hypothetical protein WBQ29_09375 [Isosphaeraceae bacterium]
MEGGEVYPDRNAVTEALIPIVNAELMALVAAGVDFVQLDEPSFACHPDAPDHFLDVVARTVRGVRAYISMHMCFGNYRGRAVGHRLYRPLFPPIGRVAVNQLALEFASRELAEVQLLAELPETMDVAVGLVDVKNTWIEPAELVVASHKHSDYLDPETLTGLLAAPGRRAPRAAGKLDGPRQGNRSAVPSLLRNRCRQGRRAGRVPGVGCPCGTRADRP